MGFSAKQLQALRRSLNGRHVRTREAHGRELSYIEGWYAISEANRIFGFDGWSRETVETRCVLARENRGSFLAVYVAKVRITVHADGATIVREGHGSGEGRGTSPVRCMTLRSRPPKPMPPNGRSPPSANHLDLSFIARTRVPSLQSWPTHQPADRKSTHAARVGFHPDDTTPIPRPSHYYGRRHQNSMTELLRRDQATAKDEHAAAAPPLAPAAPDLPRPKSTRANSPSPNPSACATRPT